MATYGPASATADAVEDIIQENYRQLIDRAPRNDCGAGGWLPVSSDGTNGGRRRR